MRRRIMFVLALVIAATAAVPAQSHAAAEPLVWIRDFEIYRSDTLGGNWQRLTNKTAGSPLAYYVALSPDGQRVAFNEGPGVGHVWVMDINSGAMTKVYTGSSAAAGSKPKFSPDGRKLVFHTGSANTGDIYTVNIDGTGLTKIVGWRDGQVDADFSPDGTKIVFSSISNPKGSRLLNSENQLFVANANGTSPVQITAAGGAHRGAFNPDWGPTGKIAFVGLVPYGNGQQGDIFTITPSGTGQQQLTAQNTYRDWGPSWSPDGATIAFGTDREGPAGTYDIYSVPSGGGAASSLINENYPIFADLPAYRQTGTADYWDYAAHEHRPYINFDTDEPWRPLDVHRMLNEGTHQVCPGNGGACSSILGTVTLKSFPSPDAYLDLGGSSPDDYKSPYPACNVDGLKECAGGPSSVIYYHVTPPSPTLLYKYIDYWWFYRFNKGTDPFGDGGDHEGDWEGMAVGGISPTTFEFASFAQHSSWFSFLRENLACDGGDTGSCGTAGSKSGRRIMAYPANGTHATYRDKCGVPSFCARTNAPTSKENDHGGEKPWLNNNDSLTLHELPPTGPNNNWTAGPMEWTDWPGAWGRTGSNGVNPPESPGNQPRFILPSAAECGDGSGCEQQKRQARMVPNAKAVARRTRSIRECEGWFAPDVVALACDRSGLRSALAKGRLGKPGQFGLTIRGRHSDSAPGLSQAVGEPLRAGQSVMVRGRGSQKTQLLVRVRYGKRIYAVTFAGVRLGKRSGRAIVRVPDLRKASGAVPTLSLEQPDGSRTAPSSVTLTRAPR